MKTFLAIYTEKVLSEAEIGYKTRYTFNTNSPIKIRDLIETNVYTTPIQIVAILPKQYKYFNRESGALSNEITGSKDFPIKEIVIEAKKKPTQLIIGSKIPKQK